MGFVKIRMEGKLRLCCFAASVLKTAASIADIVKTKGCVLFLISVRPEPRIRAKFVVGKELPSVFSHKMDRLQNEVKGHI